MKKSFLVLLSLSIIAFMGYGCYDTGGSSSGGVVVENPGSVSGASAARLYYPSGISGPVGATTMSAGYTQALGDVDWLSRAIAAKGYVVLGLTPNNNWGMVSGWTNMHKGGIAKLQQLNSSHNVLRGKIDLGKLQTCGHSKGGGGSLWASSQLRGTLKTTVGMAPYREEFSNGTLGAITAATLIQAGGADTLANNSMTRGEYGGLGNISRMYVEYSGYDHLAWTSTSGGRQGRISGDIVAWMKYYMEGDTSYAGTLSNKSGTQRHEWVNLGAPQGGNTGNGTTTSSIYSFVAVHSGKALDTWEWGTTDGTNIVQYNYWGGEAQQYYVSDDEVWKEITPVISTGQRIDVVNGATYSGANIQTWSSNGYDAQKFRFQSAGSGAYRIINKGSGLCLTVQNASMDDGANVIQDTCIDGATHQMFKMVAH